MPFKDNKIFEFNQNQNSNKSLFTIHADIECIIEKIDRCKNNPENLYTTKVNKHILSGFSMSTISSFRSLENRHDVYRGEDCMEKFCEFLAEHTIKIINFKKWKMKLLTKELQKTIWKQKILLYL